MRHPLQQRGAVLLIGLVLMIGLTLLVTGLTQAAILQSQMARHAQQMQGAFQAAEMALRDAELAIVEHYQEAPFIANCHIGLCEATDLAIQHWLPEHWQQRAIRLGTYTAAPPLSNVPIQPRYVLQRWQLPSASLVHGQAGSAYLNCFRITAQGFAGQARHPVEVRLQSVLCV